MVASESASFKPTVICIISAAIARQFCSSAYLPIGGNGHGANGYPKQR
jgi:hypothetical protein